MKHFLAASAAVLGPLFGPMIGPGAAAQEEADVEVVVTAPGPNRAADELIGAAERLDRETVLETLAGSLGDTLDARPGVSSTAFGIAASRPVLRGLGAERVQVLTNGVGVIDASAASPDHQTAADGVDAVAIEILRGPAALAYGGQAIGGVVNVIDGLIAEAALARPASGEAFAGYTSVNEGLEGAAKGRFGTGGLVVSLSAAARDAEDYDIPGFAESAQLRALEAEEGGEEEEGRDTLGNSFLETEALGLGVSYVGARGFIGASVRNQTALYGLPGDAHGEEEEGGEAEAEEAAESPFIDLDQLRYDVRAGWRAAGGGPITDVSAALVVADYEHTEFEAPGEPGTVYESDGVEGRIEIGHAIAGFEGAAGLQALDKSLDAFGDEAFITPTDTKSFGVFVYETREWESGAGIEAGLRFETVELDNINAGTRDFDLVSAALGAHRHFPSGWFVGAQLSYAERAPNESELFADGPHLATRQFEIGDTTLDKESGLNLELALRWSGEAVRFGANLFATQFSDFISLAPGLAQDEDGALVDELDGLPVFVFLQEDATFFGGELFARADVEDGPLGAEWEFGASLDLVEAEFDGGGAVPLIPPVSLNGDVSAEWGAWEVGAALSLAGEQDDPGPGQLATDGYARLDLRGEVDLSDFNFGRDGTELFIEARNITDEEIRFATSTIKDLAPAPGRNIRAGIRLTF